MGRTMARVSKHGEERMQEVTTVLQCLFGWIPDTRTDIRDPLNPVRLRAPSLLHLSDAVSSKYLQSPNCIRQAKTQTSFSSEIDMPLRQPTSLSSENEAQLKTLVFPTQLSLPIVWAGVGSSRPFCFLPPWSLPRVRPYSIVHSPCEN